MPSISKWLLIALVVLVPPIGISLVYRAIGRSRETTEATTCSERVYGIGFAMHRYMDGNNTALPPAFVIGPDGKPWHSSRVLILPYMGREELNNLYKEYRFDESWNGPNNSKLAKRMPKEYGCPSDPDAQENGHTNYFLVTGRGCVFGGSPPYEASIRLAVPQRGEAWREFRAPATQRFQPIWRDSPVIFLVESARRGVNWMEPRDISIDELKDLDANINSRHRHPRIGMINTIVHPADAFDPETLRRMCLVDPDKLPDPKVGGKRFSE